MRAIDAISSIARPHVPGRTYGPKTLIRCTGRVVLIRLVITL